MKILASVSATIAIASAIVGYLWLTQARELAQANGAIAQLRQQLATVENRVQVSRLPLLNAGAMPDPAQNAPAPAPSSPVGTTNVQPTVPRRLSSEELHEHLRDAFETQTRDPGWGTQTERTMADALRTEKFQGTKLVSARCAETLCRIELEHDSPLIQEAQLSELSRVPPFDTEGAVYPRRSERGTATTELFVARHGYRLPGADGTAGVDEAAQVSRH